MTEEQLEAVRAYIRENIDEFHNNRLNKIKNLRLTDILKRKNPFLFKAKNINTAQEFISSILDAYLSSSDINPTAKVLPFNPDCCVVRYPKSRGAASILRPLSSLRTTEGFVGCVGCGWC